MKGDARTVNANQPRGAHALVQLDRDNDDDGMLTSAASSSRSSSSGAAVAVTSTASSSSASASPSPSGMSPSSALPLTQARTNPRATLLVGLPGAYADDGAGDGVDCEPQVADERPAANSIASAADAGDAVRMPLSSSKRQLRDHANANCADDDDVEAQVTAFDGATAALAGSLCEAFNELMEHVGALGEVSAWLQSFIDTLYAGSGQVAERLRERSRAADAAAAEAESAKRLIQRVYAEAFGVAVEAPARAPAPALAPVTRTADETRPDRAISPGDVSRGSWVQLDTTTVFRNSMLSNRLDAATELSGISQDL